MGKNRLNDYPTNFWEVAGFDIPVLDAPTEEQVNSAKSELIEDIGGAQAFLRDIKKNIDILSADMIYLQSKQRKCLRSYQKPIAHIYSSFQALVAKIIEDSTSDTSADITEDTEDNSNS